VNTSLLSVVGGVTAVIHPAPAEHVIAAKCE
jgi:hypothetical protein